ncbi:MAG: hypothetical protein KF773_04480 [Deltaproteobacteria bacterium]|nr:hypothetical protein [Deltaproteobacteria bacterium]
MRKQVTFAFATIIALATPALAEPVSKEACLESHSRGQDARDQGKLSLARKLFVTCAQAACPALVQNDCARYADDLMRQQPSISFAARDASGADLPDTTVYVDGVLVVTRLDDGRPHDVDPGRHVVRFVHKGGEQEVTVVVGTGEKGRAVTARFAGEGAAARAAERSRPQDRTKHAGGSKVLLGAGAAVAIAGTAIALYGLSSVPSACSIGSNTCAAQPGDPVFADAKSAMNTANLGFMAAGLGVAALVGGVVWYKRSATTVGEAREQQARRFAPWFTPNGAGIALGGRL